MNTKATLEKITDRLFGGDLFDSVMAAYRQELEGQEERERG